MPHKHPTNSSTCPAVSVSRYVYARVYQSVTSYPYSHSYSLPSLPLPCARCYSRHLHQRPRLSPPADLNSVHQTDDAQFSFAHTLASERQRDSTRRQSRGQGKRSICSSSADSRCFLKANRMMGPRLPASHTVSLLGGGRRVFKAHSLLQGAQQCCLRPRGNAPLSLMFLTLTLFLPFGSALNFPLWGPLTSSPERTCFL